jgi:hypothetical protein
MSRLASSAPFFDNRAFRGAAFLPGNRTVRIENSYRQAWLEGRIKNYVAELLTTPGEAERA